MGPLRRQQYNLIDVERQKELELLKKARTLMKEQFKKLAIIEKPTVPTSLKGCKGLATLLKYLIELKIYN